MTARGDPFDWWKGASPDAKRALVAASLGWMLDAFDVMLYALVLPSIMTELGMDRATAGALGSLTLAVSAAGGVIFGLVADRYGRTRALTISILLYSIFTALCGVAQTAVQLAVFRIGLGLGFGGEWASGVALVSETWPDQHRGKALGLVQSSWAIGYGLAAAVTMVLLPRFGWRVVFLTGVLPALLTLWIRRRVKEPAVWLATRRTPAPASRLSSILKPPFLRLTLLVTGMNACTMFAWWGFNLWVPSYLSSPAPDGAGLDTAHMSLFVIVMQVGMWLGYVSFGFISDFAGRKRAYCVYLLAAAMLLQLYATVRQPGLLLALGPLLAFFGTGYFSGFGAVTAEIYPTSVRATAQGLTYNAGRLASALAPYAVGTLAQQRGFAVALSITAAAYLAAALFWIWIPETSRRKATVVSTPAVAPDAVADPAAGRAGPLPPTRR
jgi:MFS family permease